MANPSDLLWKILTCPYCQGELQRTLTGAECENCDEQFPCTTNGQLDFRLRKTKETLVKFSLGRKQEKTNIVLEELRDNPTPNVNFRKMIPPKHLTREMLSYFPASQNGLILDLGCGETVHREVCQHAGFHYVGVDVDSSKANILADAHALPFKNESFEAILSVATFEHIQYPFLVANEAYRVLKERGTFLGTVAFLEPFHGNSFYHHSWMGTANMLEFAGFEVQRIAPERAWSGLVALANMGLFPELPGGISKALVLPLNILHRAYWKMGNFITHNEKTTEKYRLLTNTGSFFFLASKPEQLPALESYEVAKIQQRRKILNAS